MQIVAYILSCPDREKLRDQTLANLAATDWGEPAIVEIDRTNYERRQERQTETALRLLQHAVKDGPEFFLFLEDDLAFNRYIRHNLEHWYPMRHAPDSGHFFSSLYNPRVRALGHDDALAFFVADSNSVYGSQAFVLSAATGRYIVDNWETLIGMQDIKMSRLAARVTPIYYHQPSLVQHIGVESAWGGPYHRAVDYHEDWRAEQSNHRVSSTIIVAEMRKVEGWLDDAEAKLLIDTVVAVTRSRAPCSIVEVGTYCGKSTVVLGLTLRHLGMYDSRVSTVDPHDGVVTMIGGGTSSNGATFERFQRNVNAAGVTSFINPIIARSTEVLWNEEIDLLFVDGLHDYAHVSQDFWHFAPWVKAGGSVAFHDCAPHFPGVKKLVSELIQSGEYEQTAGARSLAVLKKRPQ